MVEDDRYCIDVLTQISRHPQALRAVAIGLLDDHLRHCVADAVTAGGTDADERLDRSHRRLARLIRS